MSRPRAGMLALALASLALLALCAAPLQAQAQCSNHTEIDTEHQASDDTADWSLSELESVLDLDADAESELDSEADSELDLDADLDAEADEELQAELDALVALELQTELEAEVEAQAEVGAVPKHGARCNSNKGTCMYRASCSGGRTIASGHCFGNSYCCMDTTAMGAFPTSSTGLCGDYARSSTVTRRNNANKQVATVAVLRDHLTQSSMFGKSETQADNTMTVPLACAYDILRREALRAGHRITINSAFRSRARQEYFWNCYQCKLQGKKNCCNNGNRAARPGTSNHGNGIAIDLQLTSGAYNWMKAHAEGLGWVRTVSDERWHWEYKPGTKQSAFFRI